MEEGEDLEELDAGVQHLVQTPTPKAADPKVIIVIADVPPSRFAHIKNGGVGTYSYIVVAKLWLRNFSAWSKRFM